MAWCCLPRKTRSKAIRDWKAVQAGAEWREICHPMTGKVELKYNRRRARWRSRMGAGCMSGWCPNSIVRRGR